MAAPVPITAQRSWGIAAVVIAVISLLPGVIVALLSVTDPDYGWLLVFIAIPIAAVGGILAVIAGLVGGVYARRRRRAYAWPLVGIALGLLLVASLVFLFTPLGF